MAVSTQDSEISYTGNGSSVTPYPIPFRVLSETDIAVFHRTNLEPNAAWEELSPGAFTVTLNPANGQASLTTTQVFDTEDDLLIQRRVPFTQDQVYPTAGPFPAKGTEGALDKLTCGLQQVNRDVGTAVRFPPGSGVNLEMKPVRQGFLGLTADLESYIYTAEELLELLAVPPNPVYTAGVTRFANATQRQTSLPARVGQLGVQLDDNSLWVAESLIIGDWLPYTDARIPGLEADASSLPPAITSTADVWLRSESLTYAEGERIPAWPNAADPLKPLAQADGTKQPIRIAAGAYQTRAVAFGGISFLSASVTRTYPRTIYTVMRVRKPTPDVAAPWSTVTSGYPVLNRSSGVFGAAFYMTGDGGSYVEMPRTIRPDESWLIMRAVINGANSSLQINRDAAAYATGTIVTSTSTSLVLGAQGTALLSNLDLMEHIEFPGLLSDADDAAIHEWLNANYVQHSLLVADGTSLTFGPTNGDWPTLINPMLPGNWLVNNFAVPGQRLDQMAADAPTQIDARVNLLAKNRIMFAEAPTNTIYSITNGTDTGTPETVYAAYMAYCADRMATGKFDFLIQNTMMHRTTAGTPAGNNAFIDAVNVLIRAGAAAAGYGLADWIADPRLQDPSDTEWFSDGTHPTEKGNQEVIAPMIAAEITRWLSNHGRRTLAEDNTPTVLPTLSVTGDLRVGPRAVAVVANPKKIYMGNDIANGTPGTAGNLKIQLAEAATLEWGVGLSANLMEFQSPVAPGAFAFFIASLEVFRIAGTQVTVAPLISLGSTLWRAGTNFAYGDALAAKQHRTALFTGTPTYADDAAAATDTGLPSGSPYLITGSTALHLKP